MSNKMYFGHPVNTYDTDLELQLMRLLSERFPQWDIENPNQKHHQKGYDHWKTECGNGMDYYYKIVLPSCNAGAFLPFRDGKWGAGIFGEADFLYKQGCTIHQVTNDGIIAEIDLTRISVLSIEKTRHRLRTETGETILY